MKDFLLKALDVSWVIMLMVLGVRGGEILMENRFIQSNSADCDKADCNNLTVVHRASEPYNHGNCPCCGQRLTNLGYMSYEIYLWCSNCKTEVKWDKNGNLYLVSDNDTPEPKADSLECNKKMHEARKAIAGNNYIEKCPECGCEELIIWMGYDGDRYWSCVRSGCTWTSDVWNVNDKTINTTDTLEPACPWCEFGEFAEYWNRDSIIGLLQIDNNYNEGFFYNNMPVDLCRCNSCGKDFTMTKREENNTFYTTERIK